MSGTKSSLALPVQNHISPKLSSPNSSESSLHRVKNIPGYTTPVFKGKVQQRSLVEQDVAAKVLISPLLLSHNRFLTLSQGFVPAELVKHEVDWFYSHLGIDDTYFQNESREVISDHILALFGAKILAYTKHDPSTLVIDLERISEQGDGATFIHTSPPGITLTDGPGATCELRYAQPLFVRFFLT
jgi:glutamate dehydrogenase